MVAMVLTSITLLSQSVFQIYAAVTLKQHAQSYEGPIALETPEESLDFLNSDVLGNLSDVNRDENYDPTFKEVLENSLFDNKTVSNVVGNCE